MCVCLIYVPSQCIHSWPLLAIWPLDHGVIDFIVATAAQYDTVVVIVNYHLGYNSCNRWHILQVFCLPFPFQIPSILCLDCRDFSLGCLCFVYAKREEGKWVYHRTKLDVCWCLVVLFVCSLNLTLVSLQITYTNSPFVGDPPFNAQFLKCTHLDNT